MPRYWSDDAYAQFYGSSHAERELINGAHLLPPSAEPPARALVSAALLGGSGGGAASSSCGARTAQATHQARSAKLEREKLEDFQAAFAEWSEGHDRGIKFHDFRRFLMQLGIDLTQAQARGLWNELNPSDDSRLDYASALLAYEQVTRAPVPFRLAAGAAPPGAALPGAAWEGERDAYDIGVVELDSLQTSFSAAGFGGTREPPLGVSGLPLSAARTLLLEEGLLAAEVEALLQPFVSAGAAPSAALFEALAHFVGSFGDEGEALPASPLDVSGPPRCAPTLA